MSFSWNTGLQLLLPPLPPPALSLISHAPVSQHQLGKLSGVWNTLLALSNKGEGKQDWRDWVCLNLGEKKARKKWQSPATEKLPGRALLWAAADRTRSNRLKVQQGKQCLGSRGKKNQEGRRWNIEINCLGGLWNPHYQRLFRTSLSGLTGRVHPACRQRRGQKYLSPFNLYFQCFSRRLIKLLSTTISFKTKAIFIQTYSYIKTR